MQYYTYKVTFKDLPRYFYYGSHKDDGKPYFGSPVTWAHLWLLFEAEVQVLQWYATEGEMRAAEGSIIRATWKNKYSLNENVGGLISEEVCSKNGKKTGPENVKSMNSHPKTKVARIENGKKTGPDNSLAMLSHPNTLNNCCEQGKVCGPRNLVSMLLHPNTAATRVENGKKTGPKNVKTMNDHPSTLAARVENLKTMLAHPNTEATRVKNREVIAEKYSKPVFCVETGTVYASGQEAARHTGVDSGGIRRSCRQGGRAGGFHWKFAEEA
jgi:hypothetical protein